MSFKPACKPTDLAKLKFKEYKPEVAKSVKKMHTKGHTNMENLVPLFLDIAFEFADKSTEMLLVVGKLNVWKSHIKNAVAKDAAQCLKAYAYATFSEEAGYELCVAPVKGKMKNQAKLDKAFKALVGQKAKIKILPDMEENEDLENKAENAVETEDAEEADDMTISVDGTVNEPVVMQFIDAYNKWNESDPKDHKMAVYLQQQFTGLLENANLAMRFKNIFTSVQNDLSRFLGDALHSFSLSDETFNKFPKIKDGMEVIGKRSNGNLTLIGFADRGAIIADLLYQFEANSGNTEVRQGILNNLDGQITAILDAFQSLSTDQFKDKFKDREKELLFLNKAKEFLTTLKAKIEPFALTPLAAAKLDVTREQLETNSTFGARGVAGEQSASDVAKAKRDASVDEMALTLAKQLKLGKNKDSDELFTEAVRWLMAGSNNVADLYMKYTAATQRLYKVNSMLSTDIQLSFGNTLRNLYLQQILKNEVSHYAKLAIAAGALGKGGLAQMFSGEKFDASIIYMNYSSKQLQGLIDGVDLFAKAAYQALSSGSKEHILAMLENKKARALFENCSEDEKPAAKEALMKSHEEFVKKIIAKHKSTFSIGVSEEGYYEDIANWAETLSDEERDIIVNTPNAVYDALMNTVRVFGNDRVGHQALRIIKESKMPKMPKDAKTVSDIDKFLIERRESNNFVGKWWSNNDAGEEIQKMLFSSHPDNIQAAVVQRFQPQDYDKFMKPIPANSPDKDKLQAEKDEILRKAVGILNSSLKDATISTKLRAAIEENVLSNGTRGLTYQRLSEIAESSYLDANPGANVLSALKKLDPNSVEWQTIKEDTVLLERLKNRIIWALGGTDNWTRIAALLGLTGKLADTSKDSKNLDVTRDAYKAAKKENRLKIVSQEEKIEREKKAKEDEKTPQFWASVLSEKFGTGALFDKLSFNSLTADDFEFMMLIMEIQKKTKWVDVSNELKTLNSAAYTYVIKLLASRASGAVNSKDEDYEAQVNNLKISPNDLFAYIISDKGAFTWSVATVNRLKKAIEVMSLSELFEHCFNWQELQKSFSTNIQKRETARFNLEAATDDNRSQLQAAFDKAADEAQQTTVGLIRNLDVSPKFVAILNKTLAANFAFEVKTVIREKAVRELLQADPNVLTSLFNGLSVEEVKLVAEFIRGISSNEKEDMSRTGVQYNTLTSKGQQSAVANAEHAKAMAKANDTLNSQELKKMSNKQKDKILGDINKNLQATAEEKEAKLKSFEERKKEFNGYVKMAVNAVLGQLIKLVTTPLKGIPLLGKFIEAAAKAVVNGIVDKLLLGDKAGDWGDVVAKMGKDMISNLTSGLLGEAAPLLLSNALGANGYTIIDNAIKKIDSTRNQIKTANDALQAICNEWAKIQPSAAISFYNAPKAQDSLANALQKIDSNLTTLDNFVDYVIVDDMGDMKEKIQTQAQSFVDTFRPRLVAQRTKVNTLISQFAQVKDLNEKIANKAEAKSRDFYVAYLAFSKQHDLLAGQDLSQKAREEKETSGFGQLEEADYTLIVELSNIETPLKAILTQISEQADINSWADAFDDTMATVEQETAAALEAATQEPKDGDELQLDGSKPKESLLKMAAHFKKAGVAVPELVEKILSNKNL